jgi:hypothetical protein
LPIFGRILVIFCTVDDLREEDAVDLAVVVPAGLDQDARLVPSA